MGRGHRKNVVGRLFANCTGAPERGCRIAAAAPDNSVYTEMPYILPTRLKPGARLREKIPFCGTELWLCFRTSPVACACFFPAGLVPGHTCETGRGIDFWALELGEGWLQRSRCWPFFPLSSAAATQLDCFPAYVCLCVFVYASLRGSCSGRRGVLPPGIPFCRLFFLLFSLPDDVGGEHNARILISTSRCAPRMPYRKKTFCSDPALPVSARGYLGGCRGLHSARSLSAWSPARILRGLPPGFV